MSLFQTFPASGGDLHLCKIKIQFSDNINYAYYENG